MCSRGTGRVRERDVDIHTADDSSLAFERG